MSLPGNGIFVVQGEMAMLVTAMRRSTRWGSHSFPNEEYDVLMRTFQDLKSILNQVEDLRLIDPATYLSPFLEVIRSKETTGPVTSLALSAIHKFLSYSLIDTTHPSVPATVEDIADAVTHARFVGTDHSSDGVVLMKILQVLRTLMLSPEGAMLTDESVCEIMLSCFRICFETRLTELLRRNAEQCLRDMTQLIFMRLPQFPPENDTAVFSTVALSLKKRDRASKKKNLSGTYSSNSLDRKSSGHTSPIPAEHDDTDTSKTDNYIQRHAPDKNLLNEAEITIEPGEQPPQAGKRHGRHSSMDLATSGNSSISQLLEKCVNNVETTEKDAETKSLEAEIPSTDDKSSTEEVPADQPDTESETVPTDTQSLLTHEEKNQETSEPKLSETEAEGQKVSVEKETTLEYVNQRGIRFTPQEETVNLQPYGLVCVKELFRFLISLCNPLDSQNTSAMVNLGLCLVGTALEVSADQIAKYPSLLELIKDPLCRNLTSLLSTERISIFALDLQISFLLFEALRFHLKFQLEAFFKKILEIVSSDTSKSIYELKEIHHLALEYLAQMFRIPGLCTELYLNYDCDVYCMNMFEDLTKVLSRNVVSSTAYDIHYLSLEALMTIIEAIEVASQANFEDSKAEAPTAEEVPEPKYGRSGHITLELGGCDVIPPVDPSTPATCVGRGGRTLPTDLPSEEELNNIRNMKKWVTQGTEIFNQKPERGIEFLQEHGVLTSPQDPHQIAAFLRENPQLDKKMIGEYICKRSSRGEEDTGPSVLGAFADSFDFAGLRIDQALRHYLETFRLPGEAPLIFLVLERFAERWHTSNGEPFTYTDAAFTLAYSVIMLNMDQHNQNAKKLNPPMTVEDFVKNLRGCNGSGDYELSMLEEIFYAIKNEEMVMPAERVGPVRDAYLWRVLQRRGATAAGRYRGAGRGAHHAQLFTCAAPPSITALSSAFERSTPPSPEQLESNNTRDNVALMAAAGLERCAALAALLPAEAERLSADCTLLTLCKFTGLLASKHAQGRAAGVALGQSTKAQLALRRACAVAARHADNIRDSWRHILEIVKSLYVARLLPKCLVEAEDYLAPGGTVSLIREAARGSEAGLLSSIYSYIALGESGVRAPTPSEKAFLDVAADCVAKCNLPGLLVEETKFLRVESLQELVRAMISVGALPDADSLLLNPQLEDITIFFMELLSKTLIQNRDRVLSVWEWSGEHMTGVVARAPLLRADSVGLALACLLRTCASLMRSAQCAPHVLRRARSVLRVPPRILHAHALTISCGLYDLVKTSAQNVHTAEDWSIVFTLLTAVGAGAWPKQHANTPNSASSPSEGSEDESERRPTSVSSESELSQSPHTQGWIVVNSSLEGPDSDLEDVVLKAHHPAALARCCEALALVVRDVAHVTPHNCAHCVRAVRLFARATLHGGKKPSRDSRKSRSRRATTYEDSSEEEDNTLDQYHLISIQLLDLMHTLHSRTAQIFRWWREEADQTQGVEDYDLWEVAWMPLLQGIALFCTDRRKQVANSAIAYLQRALLAAGLTSLSAEGWQACFQRVLFPLLERLQRRAVACRANTILCKVFLHHLSALSSLPSFGAVWLRVISVQRSLISAPSDDPLTEAALESLKNMIRVMHSVKIFSNGDAHNDLWHVTWERIGEFLPDLKHELFPEAPEIPKPQTNPSLPPHLQPAPTLLPPGPLNMPTPLPIQTNPTNIQSGMPQHPNIWAQPGVLSQQLPGSLAQMSGLLAQMSGSPSPPQMSQAPPLLSSPGLVAPAPVSGMVPIRNPLYASGGLTSSVLLQPLNEMVSTPIGISMASPMPILYPTSQPMTTDSQPTANANPPASIPPSTTLDDLDEFLIVPDSKPEQSELYEEYLNNPYNESKEVSQKEALLYDPEQGLSNQTAPSETEVVRNPLLTSFDKHISISADSSPMHNRNKAQFGSTDNVKEERSIFNFSSYFGHVNEVSPAGAEIFDNLISSQED